MIGVIMNDLYRNVLGEYEFCVGGKVCGVIKYVFWVEVRVKYLGKKNSEISRMACSGLGRLW